MLELLPQVKPVGKLGTENVALTPGHSTSRPVIKGTSIPLRNI
jgi:hypothetical protein